MMTMQTEPEIKRRFKPPDSTHHKSVHVHTSLTDYVTCEFSQPSDLAHPAYSDSHYITNVYFIILHFDLESARLWAAYSI